MHVLVVDDDPEVSELIIRALACDGIEARGVSSIRRGIASLEVSSPDCILLDYRLPDGDGLAALRALRRDFANVPVVMVTGLGSESIAVEAMKLGAADYIVKHGRWIDNLGATIREVVGRLALSRALWADANLPREDEHDTLVTREGSEGYRADGIVGRSGVLLEALRFATQAAQDVVAVLIHGETGTGKELLARAIHQRGPRCAQAFVSMNCAALTDTLLESELFGHVRGAFTGAVAPRRGLFEEAHRGTIFLDEVGEMSLTAQAKLLRILEGGELRPLGASTDRRVDVRVVAATNRDLHQAIREGRFRSDLYYRLAAFPIRMPPLRERRQDIPLLAQYFLDRACAERGRRIPGFQDRTLALLTRYDWPGNVRQLRNEIERLVVMAQPGKLLPPEGLSPWIAVDHPQAPPLTRSLRAIVRDVELATIRDRLRLFGYHRNATAASLGITRVALWAKLKDLGVKPPGRRGPGS